MACAAAAPAIRQFAPGTATPDNGPHWSVAQIAKPSQAPTETRPTQTAAAEPITPVVQATSTESPVPTVAEEPPVITMEIVDEGSAPVEIQGASPASGSNGKYILVSIGEQHLYAYENGQLVYSFVASTGMGNSTRAGTFYVLDKIPNAYGANWNIWMPNWMGIYWSGSLENGIHALPILPGGGRLWAGYLGTPISYGCVVLGVEESLQLYDWAEIGTPVEIRW